MLNYVTEAKRRHKVSQNGLAKLLGITGGGLSHIVNGGPASQETIVKLARLCNEKPEVLLAKYELQRKHSPEVKMMWERIAGHAAVWLVGIVAGITALPVVVNQIYILCKIEFKQMLNE